MAEFGVNSTQLSGPQGQGASPIAPAHEKVTEFKENMLINSIGSIFAKGLEQNQKDQKEQAKNAVTAAYSQELSGVNDALVSGQMNPTQAAARTRAITNKYLAGNSQYTEDLMRVNNAFTSGTEMSDAQKQVDASTKLRQGDMDRASAAGYTFFSGMSEDAQNKTLDAYKSEVRLKAQYDDYTKRQAEQRAQNSDQRAGESHGITMEDHVFKKQAEAGILQVADSNFSAIGASVKDLMNNPSMTYEQKLAIHNGSMQRVQASLLAVAGTNPELAAPWVSLFKEMDSTAQKMLDPTVKSDRDLKMLTNQFETQMAQSKLLVISDPSLRKAVVATQLFKDQNLINLTNSPIVSAWLAQSAVDPSKAPKIVGTDQEKNALVTLKTALGNLQTGKVGDREKASMEAVNATNTIMQQTSQLNSGSIPPATLKNLSSFYSSSEFGKLAAEGKLDRDTMTNVKHVFQVQYEPQVQQAIISRLEQPLPTTAGEGKTKLSDEINIDFKGAGVVFSNKPSKAGPIESVRMYDRKKDLDQAAQGLTTLVHMGAHMEGTTDYAKYWEENKHMLLPNVFPDPAKLKPGQIVDGYKYIGGNYRDKSNWQSAASN